MDIASASDQTNAILSFNQNYNNSHTTTNQKALDKMNSTISNAKTKQSLLKGYDEGSGGVEGVAGVLKGAKTIGDARNFDSEVAGFGKGKGTSGYLRSQPQLVAGRMAQGKQKLKVAGGLMDEGDVAKSGAGLGLQREAPVLVSAPSGVGDARTLQKVPLASQTEIDADPEGAMKKGFKTQMVGADASKVADETEAGQKVAKASGGLLTASAKEGGAEGGVAGSLIKKAGKFVSDMPAGQLSAVSDIAGKGLGMFSAGKGIYDDFHGDWKTDTGAQKVANVGDIVAGGLDAVSMAIPMLAPVGAVASGISAMLDIGAQAEDTKKTIAQAHKTQTTTTTPGSDAPSLSSAGLVAKQQLSAY